LIVGGPSGERAALLVSVWAAALLGVFALVWGIVFESRVVLLDGGYVLLGLVLSWLSLRAVGVIARGPSARYPYGRESLAPLVVLVQGVAMLAMVVIAAADAVSTIRQGGTDSAPAAVIVYGLFTAVASWFVGRRLVAVDATSSIVAAEATQWRSGAALSCVVGVGAAVGILLGPVWGSTASRFVDPVLVLLVCAVLVVAAFRIGRDALRELTEMRAPTALHAAIDAAVRVTCAQFGLDDPLLRETKLGQRLYIDVEALVADETWDVARMDALRHALAERLAPLGYEPWIDLTLTNDPALLTPEPRGRH
jgi:predicted Co/Zn/Cd cation transporter (cation efflux family)